MINIRKYEEKDKENCRKVCRETSSFNLNDPKAVEFLHLMFNDYYTENESDSCFVAVDENDEAVGYLICAKDFDKYYEIFKRDYLPKINALGFKYSFIARANIFLHGLYSKKYKAHLHIDLLDVCRHQGTGSKLMTALKEYLESIGCEGLMLSCGFDNKNAIAFYKRNGFKKIANVFGSLVLVYEF